MIKAIEQVSEEVMDLLLVADPSRGQVEGYLVNSTIFVYEDDQEVVGVIVLKQHDEDYTEIMNVSVRESHRGRGIAKELMQKSVDYSRELEVSHVDIATANSSINQLALYQKSGFRITDINKDHFLNHYETPIWENGIQAKDQLVLTYEL
ncbi:MAG TPA: GNAT family N-acetyltransferase [Aliicoccus persicus]|uniref:GNAT family N-acetyltransferase n=1 Tax=Aliicoccus persicus TaxID=930138 RepID=A0A921JBZ6_9STAP|nr:GNAT family N-acetyltransferase [Aliicoccus persicus]